MSIFIKTTLDKTSPISEKSQPKRSPIGYELFVSEFIVNPNEEKGRISDLNRLFDIS